MAISGLGELIISFLNDAGLSGRRSRGLEGMLRSIRDVGSTSDALPAGARTLLGGEPKGSSFARI
jgi:hypothetical protein